MNAADRLRQRLKAGGIIAAPGAPDSLTARLIEQAGFDAIYMAGLGATASQLGCPDLGLLTQAEMKTRTVIRYAAFSALVDLPRFQALDEIYG
jgi:2-methylisocitrate lyase-like PEP mutase family enzyme